MNNNKKFFLLIIFFFFLVLFFYFIINKFKEEKEKLKALDDINSYAEEMEKIYQKVS